MSHRMRPWPSLPDVIGFFTASLTSVTITFVLSLLSTHWCPCFFSLAGKLSLQGLCTWCYFGWALPSSWAHSLTSSVPKSPSKGPPLTIFKTPVYPITLYCAWPLTYFLPCTYPPDLYVHSMFPPPTEHELLRGREFDLITAVYLVPEFLAYNRCSVISLEWIKYLRVQPQNLRILEFIST